MLLALLLALVCFAMPAAAPAAMPAAAPATMPARAEAPARLEDSVYVYDVFRGEPGCQEVVDRLKALQLRPAVVLSVDAGSGFLMDSTEGQERVRCGLQYLRSTSHTVKALLIQDVWFLEHIDEAARRAGVVAEFAARNPGLLAGMQIDVEPYAVSQWGCRSVEQRRAAMRDLLRLLGEIRRQLRGLPLALAAAWWYPLVGRELPEASPDQLFQFADEIYLMAYGDEGGPLVGGTLERVLGRLNAPEFFSGRGRVYIGLATYEFRSPAQLDATIEAVHRRLALRPNFGGTVVFHAASRFDVPLVHMLSGTVTDSEGHGLPEVEIAAADLRSQSNSCGQFGLRGLPGAQAEVVLRKQGYRTRKVPVQLSPPGEEKQLGKIVLEKEPAPPASEPRP